MRIHSDILTGVDLSNALKDAELHDVWLGMFTRHGSRSRDHAYEVKLRADHKPGRRRPNQNQEDASCSWAPTYHEYGLWMVELFKRDPDAIIGCYKGVDDFHKQTRGEFV